MPVDHTELDVSRSCPRNRMPLATAYRAKLPDADAPLGLKVVSEKEYADPPPGLAILELEGRETIGAKLRRGRRFLLFYLTVVSKST